MDQKNETQLLRVMATATTLAEQQAAAAELEALRASRRTAARAQTESMWAAETFAAAPVVPHKAAFSRATSDSDWLGEVVASTADPEAAETQMRAEASAWYSRLPQALKEHPDEVLVQAAGLSDIRASQFGPASMRAQAAFLDQIKHHAEVEGLPIPDPASIRPEPYVHGQGGEDTETSASDSPSYAEGTEPEGDTAPGAEVTGGENLDASTWPSEGDWNNADQPPGKKASTKKTAARECKWTYAGDDDGGNLHWWDCETHGKQELGGPPGDEPSLPCEGWLDENGKEASRKVASEFRGDGWYILIGGTKTAISGPHPSEAVAREVLSAQAIFTDAYEVAHIDSASQAGYDILPKTAAREKTAARIDTLRSIVENHQHQTIDGMLVDAMTAQRLVQVFDALSDANKAKFDSVPLDRLVDLAWKHGQRKRASDVIKFECSKCGMKTKTDDFSVIGRNCSATDFEEAHDMQPISKEASRRTAGFHAYRPTGERVGGQAQPGDLVQYEDMANPARAYRVMKYKPPFTDSQWQFSGEYILEPLDGGTLSTSDLRAHGWQFVQEGHYDNEFETFTPVTAARKTAVYNGDRVVLKDQGGTAATGYPPGTEFVVQETWYRPGDNEPMVTVYKADEVGVTDVFRNDQVKHASRRRTASGWVHVNAGSEGAVRDIYEKVLPGGDRLEVSVSHTTGKASWEYIGPGGYLTGGSGTEDSLEAAKAAAEASLPDANAGHGPATAARRRQAAVEEVAIGDLKKGDRVKKGNDTNYGSSWETVESVSEVDGGYVVKTDKGPHPAQSSDATYKVDRGRDPFFASLATLARKITVRDEQDKPALAALARLRSPEDSFQGIPGRQVISHLLAVAQMDEPTRRTLRDALEGKTAAVGDPCWACNGRGYVRARYSDDPYDEVGSIEITCSTCGGAGVTPEPMDYALADDPIFTDRYDDYYASRRQAAYEPKPGDRVRLKADFKDPDLGDEYKAGQEFTVTDVTAEGDQDGTEWVYTRNGPVLAKDEIEKVGSRKTAAQQVLHDTRTQPGSTITVTWDGLSTFMVAIDGIDWRTFDASEVADEVYVSGGTSATLAAKAWVRRNLRTQAARKQAWSTDPKDGRWVAIADMDQADLERGQETSPNGETKAGHLWLAYV